MIEVRTLKYDHHINGHVIIKGTSVEYDPIEGTARVILPFEFRIELEELAAVDPSIIKMPADLKDDALSWLTYRSGYSAAYRGLPASDNPHINGQHVLWDCWARGWNDMRASVAAPEPLPDAAEFVWADSPDIVKQGNWPPMHMIRKTPTETPAEKRPVSAIKIPDDIVQYPGMAWVYRSGATAAMHSDPILNPYSQDQWQWEVWARGWKENAGVPF